MRHLFRLGAAALVMALVPATAATAPSRSACGIAGKGLTPVGHGPLVLKAVHCLELPHGVSGASPPAPSLDRKAFFVFDRKSGLWLGKTGSKATLHNVEADMATLNASENDQPFAWTDRGQSVFGVRQKNEAGRWLGARAAQAVRCLNHWRSPSAASARESRWSAGRGPLVGNAGLAIVLFGTKGSYYRPVHRDPLPTIALVDARGGRIIQSFSLADLTPARSVSSINQVAWRIDRRGRIEALITLAPYRWILWKQGQTPQRMPINVRLWRTKYALSPDGRSVLMMRGLSATGVMCVYNPKCPPPTPSTGVVAELREIRSGKVVWSVAGTASTFSNDGMPAISPNGRYALISMPSNYRGETAALIKMASGKILQKNTHSGSVQ